MSTEIVNEADLQAAPDGFVGLRDRLSTLAAAKILDTATDPAFDGIVRLATRLCQTPVGLVSFVDADRQWFKARVDFPHCETDLERSVCKFALAEPDLLIIPDLAADPRTAANPLVTGSPFIRFYAGAPLRMPNGQVLGSLSVIDTVPRPGGLTSEQAEDLRTLAAQVVDQLELRRSVKERDRFIGRQGGELHRLPKLDVLARASAALLVAEDPAEALASILVGSTDALGFDWLRLYEVEPDGRHLRLSRAIDTIPGARARSDRLPFGTPLCGIVAETRRALLVGDGLEEDQAYEAQLRALGLRAYAGFPLIGKKRLGGVLAFGSSGGEPFDAETLIFFETLARLLASVHDRLDVEEALAETGAYWRSLFERLSEGFVVGEVIRDASGRVVDWRYVEVNQAWGGLVGMDARSIRGRTIRDVFPGVEDEWIDEFARVVETGEAVTFQRKVASLDRWYEGRVFSVGAGRFAVVFLEITDRIQADARRAAQLALGDRLSELTTIPEMTRAASEIIGRTLSASRAGYGRIEGDVDLVHIEADWTVPGVASIVGRHRLNDYGDIRDHLRRGEALVIHDVTTDPRTRDDPAPLQVMQAGALVDVPVRDRGRTVALFFVHSDAARTWTDEELAFLRNVADRLEAGVARLRAEEDQRILNEEIAHRLKNTLAMVLSIASQTLRKVPERAPIEAFEQRIHALSAAHNVLLRRTWTSATMRDVVTAVTEAAGHGGRITLSGPDLDLGPRATLSVSLLVHELATNAAKYGGLSTSGGHVSASWHVKGRDEQAEVVLDWVEKGGPPPVAPAQSRRNGFGSRLIAMGLAGSGGVDLRYPPSGFEATMRAPLEQLQDA
ncbi:GAF domain-containing protein [Lichenibacterium minor]|uniref:histidine kinase n=1 Tax=Lichenibacterium minor TaxID=2316528 RepID=A0A4Q2TYZ2_9HYPH|nr:GAF domain-containing protein [Lichenibacterium minor]RYC29332.1 GAF domain-containing protein [Lichenibacterium minor]